MVTPQITDRAPAFDWLRLAPRTLAFTALIHRDKAVWSIISLSESGFRWLPQRDAVV